MNDLQELKQHPIILFDGICNFCNWIVDFILTRDSKELFRFTALQSDAARLLATHKPELSQAVYSQKLTTLILIHGDKVFYKSTAVAYILRKLPGWWKFLGIALLFIPQPVRDFHYDRFAKWRYRIFGKRKECRLPSSEERNRFLS